MSGGYEIVVWFILIAASVTDLLWGKIYNHLTLTFIVGGVIVRLFLEGFPSASNAIYSIGTAFILFFPLYYLKVLAAGDVKLLMAIGAWANSEWVIRISLTSIVIGAVVGAFIMIRKRMGSQEPQTLTRMPFGPAFLCSLLFLKIAEFKGWVIF